MARALNFRIVLAPGVTVDLGADTWAGALEGLTRMRVSECEPQQPFRLTLDDLAKLAAEPVAEAPPVPQRIGVDEPTIAVGVNGTAT